MRENHSYGSVGEQGGNEPRYPEVLTKHAPLKVNNYEKI